jgi:HD-like signal output (HDOD) protein
MDPAGRYADHMERRRCPLPGGSAPKPANAEVSEMMVDELLSGVMDLIPLPKAYLRLRELIADPESSLSDITQVISNDPALTSRILRIVNSAYFALPNKVDTIERAVQVLGLNQVHDLALASASVSTLSGIPCPALDIHDYWRRSIYTAVVARILARRMSLRTAERLFVAGLLHGIGELVLAYKEPVLFGELKSAATRRELPLSVVQQAHLGFDYAAISAELLHRWQLPDEIVMPVRHHAATFAASPSAWLNDACILQVGAVVSRAAMWRSEEDEPVPPFEPVAMAVTRLDEQAIEEVMSDADRAVIEAMSLLLPDLKAGRRKTVPA